MKSTSSKSVLVLLAIIVVAGVLTVSLSVGASSSTLRACFSKHCYDIHQAFVRQLLLHEHDFIPASDDRIQYGGQWKVQVQDTVRKTATPGSYFEVVVTNSSSLYLSLADPKLGSQVGHLHFGDADGSSDTRCLLSLVVQLSNRNALHFHCRGPGLIKVGTGLDPLQQHAVRVTLLESADSEQSRSLSFHGLWVVKDGMLSGSPSDPTLHSQQPDIEVLSEMSVAQPTDATSVYPILLASSLGLSLSQVPISGACLMEGCAKDRPSIPDIYFDVGRDASAQFWASRKVVSTYRSAIVLSLGLYDFDHLLAALDQSEQDVHHFVRDFVQTYAEFISTIRRVDHSQAKASKRPALDRLASYMYNSAPSMLPIFILTPLTSSRQLRRLLGHATSAVAQQLRADGDLSTTWIDSNGWLSQEDFIPRPNSSTIRAPEQLTLRGHARVAAHLSTQLCPYFKQDCPYSKHTFLGGHLYIPVEASMGKLLEERKVTLAKEFLKIS